MLYSYGTKFMDSHGQTIRNEEANYILGQIKPDRLTNEVIVELGETKFIAVSFEFPFSSEKSYTIDFDGEHMIVY